MSHPWNKLILILLLAVSFALGQNQIVHLQILTVNDPDRLSEILTLLEKSEDFADLAKKYSTHPSGKSGGYLGEVNFRSLSDEMQERVRVLEEGSMVHFFSSQLGYTIVRRLDERTARSAYARQAMLRGKSELDSGRIKSAVQELKRALSLDPSLAKAHMYLGEAYRLLGTTAMSSEAKSELRQALALDPSLVSARFTLALIYLELDFVEKAKEVLQERIELVEENPMFLAVLSEVNRRLGHPELAIRQSQQALELDSNLPNAHYYMGLAYLDQSRKEEAIRALQKAETLGLNRPDIVYLKLGLIQQKSGELDQAVESYEKVLEFNSRDAHAHGQLARVLFEQEKYELSLEHARKARELGAPMEEALYEQIVQEAENVRD